MEFGCKVVLLITISASHLTHVFSKSVLINNRIVECDVNKVYTGGRSADYCLTQLLITTISSNSSRVFIRSLGGCSCQSSGLTVSWFAFFFFMRFRVVFFLSNLRPFQQQVSTSWILVKIWRIALNLALMDLSSILS